MSYSGHNRYREQASDSFLLIVRRFKLQIRILDQISIRRDPLFDRLRGDRNIRFDIPHNDHDSVIPGVIFEYSLTPPVVNVRLSNWTAVLPRADCLSPRYGSNQEHLMGTRARSVGLDSLNIPMYTNAGIGAKTMVTTTIHRVGQSYRLKFTGHCLRSGARTDGYFTADELEELRVAVEQAQARIHELNQECGNVERANELFGRYQDQLRQIDPNRELGTI
jgi:hypothetical protein